MDNKEDMPLSEHPDENLRMENELLRLKLQAELGAESHSIEGIDPEIENQFLKNILEFEHNFARSKPAKVYDLLGKPIFKMADELNDDELDKALQEITDLMTEKNIEVNFGEGYDNRIKYRFITEELFGHESSFPPMPGMTTFFDYEEFHPNHKKDIEETAMGFITKWFEQNFGEYSPELAQQFILPDRKILSDEQVKTRMKHIFDAYRSFSNTKYVIDDINFKFSGDSGIGHAGGGVKYMATMENGETIEFRGPFKLYMENEYGLWKIFHIVFPGFEYF